MIEIRWLQQKLEEKSLTQIGLAKALGVARSNITRMFQGERVIYQHEIPKILEYLGEKPLVAKKETIRQVAHALAKNSDWIQMEPSNFEELIIRLIEHVEEEELSKDNLDAVIKWQDVG